MIAALDQAIHNFCTSVSHRLQRTTGLTCYFIARVGVSLAALNVLASIVNYFFPFLPERTDLVLAVLSALLLWSCVNCSIACQRGDEATGSDAKPAELMPYMGTAFWRVLWVAWAIFGLAAVHWLSHALASFVQDGAFSLGFALFYNFINVTPLPPGTSKLKEWIKGFFSTPELARQEN
jgi:hypothetical protein